MPVVIVGSQLPALNLIRARSCNECAGRNITSNKLWEGKKGNKTNKQKTIHHHLWSMYPSRQSDEVTPSVISGVIIALDAKFIQADFVRQAF